MKSCFSEVLDDILLRSAEALFEKRGIELSRASTGLELRIDDRHVGGLLEFEGPQIRGSLLLISTFQTAAKMRGPQGASGDLSSRVAGDWIVIRDWTGELANQLLGRIKNRLQSFGVNFQIGAPVLLSGPGLALAGQAPNRVHSFVYRRGDDLVKIVVDLRAEPQLGSTRPIAADEASAREGDVIEF
jgi:CheY-specific phosphatase CheX